MAHEGLLEQPPDSAGRAAGSALGSPAGSAPAAAGDTRRLLAEALRRVGQLNAAAEAARTAEPIAVVGLGCRMPGGAADPEAFWAMLRDGVDATGEFPAERADAAPYYDPDPEVPGKAYVTRGAFLDEVDRFEPGAFGISPREAIGMDPQQRLTLEVVWEALERAGYAPDRLEGSKTGVFLGVSTTDYVRARQEAGDIRDVDGYQLIGEPSFIAGRVSYTFGLMGPSKVVDTTCSSSLVALHDACESLRRRECDLALAGGVNLMLTPYGFVLLSKFRALAPDGRCKTFSAAADGYARGEGVGIVVLKRLSDALAADDDIAAVIRGTAVNHDGRSSGISVPSPAAQQAVIRAALAQARLDPADVGYVEAHGTGTALGDPIELRALQEAIGRHHRADDPLLVGSVKTNIGHLESAAGVAGLLKVVLALGHGELPPHLHLTERNPNVDWDALNIEVVTGVRPWAAGPRARVGAVSSFGASGTNAHAIVSEPPPRGARSGSRTRDFDVVTLSARSETALRTLARSYAARLRAEPALSVADVALTTHLGRSRLPVGVAIAAPGSAELADGLDAFVAGRREDRTRAESLPGHRHRKVAWLFTGQGSQYPQMGELARSEPAYAEAIDEVAALLDPLLDRPLATLLAQAPTDPADPVDATSPLHQTGYAQPALFAVEYALARTWRSWGLEPSALLGHSVGEIVAATVAGVLELPDACRLIAARGRAMQALPPGGTMATLVCDEATAQRAIAGFADTVSIAAVNGPADTVISGPAPDIAAITEALTADGVKHLRLRVSHAFHSPLIEPALAELREVAASITHRAPQIPLISNLTGAIVRPGEIDADHWVRHARGTVRFADGIRTLYDNSFRTFLEIGPQPVLSGLGSRGLDDPTCRFVPTLRRGLDDRQSLAVATGALYLRGTTVDWNAYHQGTGARRIPLPSYPWEGEPYWFPQATAIPVGTNGDPVTGLGHRLRSAQPTYQLDLTAAHWRDEASTQPTDSDRDAWAGTLLQSALTAARDGIGGAWAAIRDLTLGEPLSLNEGRTVHLVLTDEGTPTPGFEVRSTSDAEEACAAPWRLHARGRLSRTAGMTNGDARALAANSAANGLAGARDRDRRAASGWTDDRAFIGDGVANSRDRDRRAAARFSDDRVFAAHSLAGTEIDWKPGGLSRAGVRAVVRVERDTGGVVLELAAGQGLATVLEAAVAATAWVGSEPGIPAWSQFSALTELTCADPASVRFIRAVAQTSDTGTIQGSARLYNAARQPLGTVEGIRIPPPASTPATAPWRDPRQLIYRMEWQKPDSDEPARRLDLHGLDVLLIADRLGVAERFAAALTEAGAVPTIAAAPATEPGDGPGGVLHRSPLTAMLAAWHRERAHEPAPARTPPRPARIIVLTGLDAPDPETCAAEDLITFRDRTELLVLGLIQAQRHAADPAKVVLVTRGAVSASPEQRDHAPAATALWGLGRVVALEQPQQWGAAIDLDPDAPDLEDAGPELAQALAWTEAEDQQALRDGNRLVARIVAARLPADRLRRQVEVRPSGSYLITGAFGGIGRELARWLALRGAGRLVLLGRTRLPEPEECDDPLLPEAIRERIRVVRELRGIGSEVEVVAADVADHAAVSALVERLAADPRRPLAGVVHAAGVSGPQFVTEVSRPEYHAVWSPKVLGGWALHRATTQTTAPISLDFFLGFSSIAATWGSQHLASYAAANAFLDGLADHRAARGLPALTVAWSSWELESALFDSKVGAFLAATGLRPLSSAQSLALTGALLGGPEAHHVVCSADWARYKEVLEARAERPVFRRIEVPAAQAAPGAAAAVLAEVLGAEPGARTGLLAGYLREQLAQLLQLPVADLAGEFHLLELGLDSLMVMELISRCRKDLGIGFGSSEFFAADANDWAAFLLARVEDQNLGARSADAADHTAADQGW